MNNTNELMSDSAKYFDRINDKLFSVNNILIAAYMALVAFKKSVPFNLIWLPLLNVSLIILIEMRLLRNSNRLLVDGNSGINNYIKKGNQTNFLFFASLLLTVIEMALFLKYVS